MSDKKRWAVNFGLIAGMEVIFGGCLAQLGMMWSAGSVWLVALVYAAVSLTIAIEDACFPTPPITKGEQ